MGSIFVSEFHLPKSGLMTVTRVQVSDDLQNAKVFVSFINEKKEISELIEDLTTHNKQLRYHLGNKLSLKYVPKLKFFHDDTLITAERINELMKKIQKNKD